MHAGERPSEVCSVSPDSPSCRCLVLHFSLSSFRVPACVNISCPPSSPLCQFSVFDSLTASLFSRPKKCALIENHLMGGDCLNVGCVPSKALISAARVANTVRHPEAYVSSSTTARRTWDVGSASLSCHSMTLANDDNVLQQCSDVYLARVETVVCRNGWDHTYGARF